MTQAYPLHWPAGWKRTERPQRAPFWEGNGRTTLSTARDFLYAELERLRARDVVLSSNLRLRLDGKPAADQREPEDPGVAVYFTTKDGRKQCFPCDKWDRCADNMKAIAKTIEALRGLERWGAKETVDAAFRGFQALPAPQTIQLGHEDPAKNPYMSLSKSELRNLMKVHHPDTGGDRKKFDQVMEAWRAKGE